MLAALLLLFTQSLAQGVPSYGLERCSADDGPEVGVGILCDRARSAIEARELLIAEELALTATELAPSHPGVWILLAEVVQTGRRVEEARGHFEKAAGLEPENPAILVLMGDFEAAEGNVRGAAVLYEQAAEIDSGYPGLAERLEALSGDPELSEI